MNFSSFLIRKFFFLVFFLFLFRFLYFTPSAGINSEIFFKNISNGNLDSLGIFRIFSLTSTSNLSLLSIGLMPYILSSIFFQLLLSMGRKFEFLIDDSILLFYLMRISLIIFSTIYFTISFFSYDIQSSFILQDKLYSTLMFFASVLSGSLISVWIGECITEYLMGSGISFLILVNIIADLILSLSSTQQSVYILLLFLVVLISILFLIVCFESSTLNLKVRRLSSKKDLSLSKFVSSDRQNCLPIKLNISGIMPIIFSNTLIFLIVSIINSTLNKLNFTDIKFLSYLFKFFVFFSPFNNIFYYLSLFILLVFFSRFYAFIVLEPDKVADNFRKNASILEEQKPGKATSSFLQTQIYRLSYISAFYLFFTSLSLDYAKNYLGFSFLINGSSFLVLVVIVMDLVRKISSEYAASSYTHASFI